MLDDIVILSPSIFYLGHIVSGFEAFDTRGDELEFSVSVVELSIDIAEISVIEVIDIGILVVIFEGGYQRASLGEVTGLDKANAFAI